VDKVTIPIGWSWLVAVLECARGRRATCRPLQTTVSYSGRLDFRKRNLGGSVSTVEVIGRELERIHQNLVDVLDLIPEERLYLKPFESPNFIRVYSCGELISHIGGIVEYTFNGITSNLWEEPFEWITREVLPTRAHVAAYLEEVARVRRMAFDDFRDDDLPKQIYFPNGVGTTLGEILTKTLSHAAHHRGQVYAYVHLFTDVRLPATVERRAE
jgi:uncharacterized damage-inducible protein DinB